MNNSRISFKIAQLFFFSISLSLITACGGGGNSGTPLSSAKQITAFSFTNPSVVGTIDQSAKTIAIRVPSITDVSALIANFTTTGQSVVVGSTTQTSGITPNNFTNPLTYQVNAADGSYQNYTVTVTIAPTLAGEWARTTLTVGSTCSGFSGVSVSSDGSIYAVGSIYGTGTYNFGNSVTATGTSPVNNIIIIKYNRSGVAQWAQTLTAGNDYSGFSSVAVASDGSVYAVGFIRGTGIFNFGNSVTATGTYTSNNVVILKYNSSGVAQWAQTVTAGDNYSGFDRVSVASDGSVYAAGYIYGTGTFNFGNGVHATGAYTGSNPVLMKYNSSGVAQWAQTVTAGSNDSYFNSVSIASDGSVCAAGNIYGTGTYNFGNSVTATGVYTGSNAVLLKYNSSGVAQWAQTVTAGNSDSHFRRMSVSSDGSVYAAGYIYGPGTYNFGNSVTATGTYTGTNIILVKYNSSGLAQWAQTVTIGNSDSYFNGVSVAPDGSIYTAGIISGSSTYHFSSSVSATGTYQAMGNAGDGDNIVIVKYNSSGVAQWAQSVTSGNSDSSFSDVSVAADGSIYAAGVISGSSGPYDFGNGATVTTAPYIGNYIILVKYD
jgi:hypothetical protein